MLNLTVRITGLYQGLYRQHVKHTLLADLIRQMSTMLLAVLFTIIAKAGQTLKSPG